MDKKKKKITAILGRKTQYRKILDDVVFKLCLLKAIDSEIAEVLCVSEQTLNTWKEKHPTFLESIKKGKAKADANVAERLYERAMGYSHPETKVFCHEGEITTYEVIKHYPPDFSSMCFWLKNRAGWKDVTDYSLNIKVYTIDEREEIRKKLASRCIDASFV
jgi:hypothetical protein